MYDGVATTTPCRYCDTLVACNTHTLFKPLKLFRLFGYKCFCNQRHFITTTQGGTLQYTGELPPTLWLWEV